MGKINCKTFVARYNSVHRGLHGMTARWVNDVILPNIVIASILGIASLNRLLRCPVPAFLNSAVVRLKHIMTYGHIGTAIKDYFLLCKKNQLEGCRKAFSSSSCYLVMVFILFVRLFKYFLMILFCMVYTCALEV